MQTNLADFIAQNPEAKELEKILRSCVHCGFCNATCPTYQLTGNELDGPRGRIYLLKQMFEGQPVSHLTQNHLDRCLNCRACETTCPSGVNYSGLLDSGRPVLEKLVTRHLFDRLKRYLITRLFPYQRRFALLLSAGRLIKPLLPKILQKKIPARSNYSMNWPDPSHHRKMLILNACVQPSLAPQIDVKVANILDKLSISLIRVDASGCCGALDFHLSKQAQAQQWARINIDACWPYIEQGAEAIVATASGCGLMLKEYRELLKDDLAYADKAAKIAELTLDICELLSVEDISQFKQTSDIKLAFQAPCTLQHGQQITNVVEPLLESLGYQLNSVENSHLCCGSAGVYSLLQPEIATRLQIDKLACLLDQPVDIIATANIGCLMHLQTATNTPVVHWVELL